MKEHLLITKIKQNDSYAQRWLYEKYAPVMMSVCMRYVNEWETARDLLQEGFIKVFTRIDMYHELENGSFVAWMRRVFATTSLEYLRKHDVLKMHADIDVHGERMADENCSVLDSLSADEIMVSVGRLPDGYRTVFNLYAIEGYSHQEIAGMLGIKEATSRSQFLRARKILQEEILSLLATKDGK